MRRTLLVVVMAVAGVSLHVRAGQTPAESQFRAGVDLVQVDVSVLDRQRKPVRGLTAADFTLLEDGKPRPIVAFTAVELPPRTLGPAPWTETVAPDVSSNTIPEEGRLVIILIDRSIPDGYPSLNAQSIARTIVQGLGAGDLAAVVSTGGGMPQNFTNDRARLLKAIASVYAPAEASEASDDAWDTAVGQMLEELDNRPPPAALAALTFSAACHCGACVPDAIARIADAVRDVPRRRKTLMFIGTDIQVETIESICIDPVTKARNAMFRSIDLASMTVHAFDPGGLQTLSPQAGWRGRGYRGRANLVRQGNISVLPDRTGGRTILNTNDPLLRVPEILAESDSYYLIGFEPATADGRRHDISVKVNRRGLDVRTRREYLAEPPAAPPATAAAAAYDAITGMLPSRGGVSMSARASALAVPGTADPVIALALHVAHEPGAGGPARTSDPEPVEVTTAVFTARGRAVGALRQTLSVTPSPDGDGQASYDIVQRLPAQPGRYEIRVGLHNRSRGQTGSVFTYVDVPDFQNAPFAMGDLALYTPAGARALSADLAGVLLAPPTARRDLDRGDRATAFLRLYQMSEAAPVAVALSARIVDGQDRRRYGQDTVLEHAAFRDGFADYVVDLPLADLEPGAYLLAVEAKAGTTSARRDLRFRVR